MAKLRVLVTDESSFSLKAKEILKIGKIGFTELSCDSVSSSSSTPPYLLAPEGRFEGVQSVSMYVRAEKNGIHKR